MPTRRVSTVGPHPDPDASKLAWTPKANHQLSRWSEAILWAWEDLNLRPHPYRQSAGNRCAQGPFPQLA